jgi:hypothetical protein
VSRRRAATSAEPRRCVANPWRSGRSSSGRSTDTAESQWSLAEILRKQRKWSEAEAAHREALAARRAALPSGHEAIGDSLLGLGRTLAESGRPSEAEAPLSEAMTILRSAPGKRAKEAMEAERALADARTARQR